MYTPESIFIALCSFVCLGWLHAIHRESKRRNFYDSLNRREALRRLVGGDDDE